MKGRNIIFLESLIALKEKNPLYWIMIKDIKFGRYLNKQLLRDIYMYGFILLRHGN